MAYDEKLADRVRELIAEEHKDVEEKKMFGGLCFMVNDRCSLSFVSLCEPPRLSVFAVFVFYLSPPKSSLKGEL